MSERNWLGSLALFSIFLLGSCGKGEQAKLEEETRKYINSERGTRIDRAGNQLYLSKLFDWFSGDFEYASGSVLDFIKQYIDSSALAFLEQNPKIKWLEYDWALNAQGPIK